MVDVGDCVHAFCAGVVHAAHTEDPEEVLFCCSFSARRVKSRVDLGEVREDEGGDMGAEGGAGSRWGKG